MNYVVPYQVVLMLVVFLLLSRKYPPTFCFILFPIAFVISILGVDSLSFALVTFGLYSLGYLFHFCLCKEKAYGVTNIAFGVVILFFPLFILSVISTVGLTAPFEFINSTKLATNICMLLFVGSISIFIYKEHNRLVTYLSMPNSNASVNFLSFVMLALILSLFSYVAVPIINYDDLGTHYYIQNQFSLGHYPSFNVSNHVWAVSQWLFDIYYGLFESLFDGLGRTTLNLLLAFATVASLFSLIYKKTNINLALLVVLLSVSSPIFTLSLTASQTELVSVFLLVNILCLSIPYTRNSLLLSLPLFALSVCIKPSNAVIFIFPLFVLVYIEISKYRFENIKSKKFILMFLISTFIAFGIYLFAYLKTGNPFFPLFNSIFKADHFPHTNFFNSLYSGNFNLNAFTGLIFETSKYLESSNGVIGYQLIFLPVIILTLPFLFRDNMKSTMLLLSMLIGGLCIFYSQQYARYIMPVLFIIPVLYVIIISSALKKNNRVKLVVIVLSSIVIFFNIYKTPKVIWYLNKWDNNNSFSAQARQEIGSSYERIFSVNSFLNTLPGNIKVLYPYEKPYASNLDGEYIYVNWYNTAATKAYKEGMESLFSYLKEQRVTHLVLTGNSNDSLKKIALEYGSLIYQDVVHDVYKLDIFQSDFKSYKKVKFGNPQVFSESSFEVTPSDFYMLEYDKITNKDKLKFTVELNCRVGDVWKDYVEYNRNSNFSNFFRVEKCLSSVFRHELVLKLPSGTDNLRIFLQPISGNFKVTSVTLQDFVNDK